MDIVLFSSVAVSGFEGPVAPTRHKQREESMSGMSCILQDPAGSVEAESVEDALQLSNYFSFLANAYDPLESFYVCYCAAGTPSCEGTCHFICKFYIKKDQMCGYGLHWRGKADGVERKMEKLKYKCLGLKKNLN